MSKRRGKLSADYGIDAMVAEVERRKGISGDTTFSYGKLAASLNPQERQRIKEDYRRNFHSKGRECTGKLKEFSDEEDVNLILAKAGESLREKP